MFRRLLAVALLAATGAAAQTTKPNEPVVVPQVDRRDVKPPRFPSNDFEVGVFAGIYEMQSFGSSAVSGLRLGYHITEDVFVEGAYGRTKVSDETFRQIFPNGGVFPSPSENLTYYNLSAGYNVLPGEVFFGRNVAKASAFYVILGVGTTTFVDQKKQTINAGFGTRLLFNDHFAVQADVRSHVFSFDLLGQKQNAKNLEATLGLTVFF
jgi:outer membrane beta-barrel protein